MHLCHFRAKAAVALCVCCEEPHPTPPHPTLPRPASWRTHADKWKVTQTNSDEEYKVVELA